jgi:hypothetical protein
MVFSSLIFLFLFLPIALIAFYIPKIFTLHIYETQLLFHLLNPLDNFNYWDKRIDNLPLPDNFVYKGL